MDRDDGYDLSERLGATYGIYHVKPEFFGRRDLSFPSQFDHVADIAADSLDEAFTLSQNIDDAWLEGPSVRAHTTIARSTCVGDVIVSEDGSQHRVGFSGFELIRASQSLEEAPLLVTGHEGAKYLQPSLERAEKEFEELRAKVEALPKNKPLDTARLYTEGFRRLGGPKYAALLAQRRELKKIEESCARKWIKMREQERRTWLRLMPWRRIKRARLERDEQAAFARLKIVNAKIEEMEDGMKAQKLNDEVTKVVGAFAERVEQKRELVSALKLKADQLSNIRSQREHLMQLGEEKVECVMRRGELVVLPGRSEGQDKRASREFIH